LGKGLGIAAAVVIMDRVSIAANIMDYMVKE
jgi:hypothetical protein